jgi:hypothetical protein
MLTAKTPAKKAFWETQERNAMKPGPSHRKAKKALTVATALTGVTAGAAGLLPGTAAYAATSGYQIKITMGAQVTRASFCGQTVKDVIRCVSAFNQTDATAFSVPFTELGIVRTFVAQSTTLHYGGPTIGNHSAPCAISGPFGTKVWFANAKRVSC